MVQVNGNKKRCAQCGKPMLRDNVSPSNWAKRKFCGAACQQESLRREKPKSVREKGGHGVYLTPGRPGLETPREISVPATPFDIPPAPEYRSQASRVPLLSEEASQ